VPFVPGVVLRATNQGSGEGRVESCFGSRSRGEKDNVRQNTKTGANVPVSWDSDKEGTGATRPDGGFVKGIIPG